MADLHATQTLSAFDATTTKFTTASWDVRQGFGLRAQLLDTARDLLAERGRELAGEPVAPPRVFVQTRGTAILARMRYPASERRLVLKPARLNEGERDAKVLAGIMRDLGQSDPRIAAGLAPVLDYDEARNMLILEHVPGDQLCTHLRNELRFVVTGQTAWQPVLRDAALFLAAVHRVPASRLLPGRPTRTYQSFADAFRSHAQSMLPSFRRAGFDGPDCLLALLSGSFFTRVGDRMSIADARPKNIIVRPGGRPAFIDLDCSPAPAALGVALFLVALDRVASRCPYVGVRRRLRSWKRAFVEAYCEDAEPGFAEDLTFFYPWSVVQMLCHHGAQRPAVRPYLSWFYGRELERFLVTLRRLPASTIERTPAALFDTAPARVQLRPTWAPRVTPL